MTSRDPEDLADIAPLGGALVERLDLAVQSQVEVAVKAAEQKLDDLICSSTVNLWNPAVFEPIGQADPPWNVRIIFLGTNRHQGMLRWDTDQHFVESYHYHE